MRYKDLGYTSYLSTVPGDYTVSALLLKMESLIILNKNPEFSMEICFQSPLLRNWDPKLRIFPTLSDMLFRMRQLKEFFKDLANSQFISTERQYSLYYIGHHDDASKVMNGKLDLFH